MNVLRQPQPFVFKCKDCGGPLPEGDFSLSFNSDTKKYSIAFQRSKRGANDRVIAYGYGWTDCAAQEAGLELTEDGERVAKRQALKEDNHICKGERR